MFEVVPLQMTELVPVSAIDVFLTTWLSPYSKATRSSYSTSMKDFARFTRCMSTRQAVEKLFACDKRQAAEILAAWRYDLGEIRGKAAGTCNNRLAAMRSLLSAAREYDFVPWAVPRSCLKDFRAVPYRDTRGPGLKILRQMLERIDGIRSGKLRFRNRAILRLLYDCGLRAGELVALDMGDVDIPGKRLWILGKGRDERQPITLPAITAKVLVEWLDKRGWHAGPVFTILSHNKTGCRICRQTVFRFIRDLGEACGAKTSPHRIRHSAITTAATTLSLLDAQQFARHTNPQVTVRYVDNARDRGGVAARKVAATLEPTKPRKPR